MRVPTPASRSIHPDHGCPSGRANRIICQDIREAHFLYAHDSLNFYSGIQETEVAEKRYRQVASGAIRSM
jgi:hypothetical protein